MSWAFDLESHGVAIRTVPSGLPSLGLPDVTWSDVVSILGVSASIFIVVLAQSAATSRAYAAKYDDAFSEDVDLIGLSGAYIAAGLTGTFVVNGSPTKTQMVDGAGGTSQVAQLTTGVVVVIVLLFLTVPLQYLPSAVLASVVFVIGIELVDIAGMRRVLAARTDEFVVAAVTALTVVFVGVEQAIVLAIVLSIVDHLRRSYQPATAVLIESDGHLHTEAVTVDARSTPGLVIYRFAGPLYYANANHFLEDVTTFVKGAGDSELAWCPSGEQRFQTSTTPAARRFDKPKTSSPRSAPGSSSPISCPKPVRRSSGTGSSTSSETTPSSTPFPTSSRPTRTRIHRHRRPAPSMQPPDILLRDDARRVHPVRVFRRLEPSSTLELTKL